MDKPNTRGRCIRLGCKVKQRHGLVCRPCFTKLRAIAAAATVRQAQLGKRVRYPMPNGSVMIVSPEACLRAAAKALKEEDKWEHTDSGS